MPFVKKQEDPFVRLAKELAQYSDVEQVRLLAVAKALGNGNGVSAAPAPTKRRGRPVGSKNKPKTQGAESGVA